MISSLPFGFNNTQAFLWSMLKRLGEAGAGTNKWGVGWCEKNVPFVLKKCTFCFEDSIYSAAKINIFNW